MTVVRRSGHCKTRTRHMLFSGSRRREGCRFTYFMSLGILGKEKCPQYSMYMNVNMNMNIDKEDGTAASLLQVDTTVKKTGGRGMNRSRLRGQEDVVLSVVPDVHVCERYYVYLDPWYVRF